MPQSSANHVCPRGQRGGRKFEFVSDVGSTLGLWDFLKLRDNFTVKKDEGFHRDTAELIVMENGNGKNAVNLS